MREDGVRLRYICGMCDKVRKKVIEVVRMMFDMKANEWDECMKSGIIVPLFKKGDKSVLNMYYGVCLLFNCARVLARVNSKRLPSWAESLGLHDDNQTVFCSGRSTAGVVKMKVMV